MGKNIDIKQNKKGYYKKTKCNTNYKFIEKIDGNYFLGYDQLNKNIQFLYFNEKTNNIDYKYKLYIAEDIFSISKSTLEKKIFFCLSSLNKTVKIVEDDLEKNIFDLSEIKGKYSYISFYHYYKCIQLSKNIYAT